MAGPRYAGVNVNHPAIVSTIKNMVEKGESVGQIMKITGMPQEVVLSHKHKAESAKEEKAAVVRSFRETVLPLFAQNRIRPIIDRVFPFEGTAKAHAYMESNASFGKIVVEMG